MQYSKEWKSSQNMSRVCGDAGVPMSMDGWNWGWNAMVCLAVVSSQLSVPLHDLITPACMHLFGLVAVSSRACPIGHETCHAWFVSPDTNLDDAL